MTTDPTNPRHASSRKRWLFPLIGLLCMLAVSGTYFIILYNEIRMELDLINHLESKGWEVKAQFQRIEWIPDWMAKYLPRHIRAKSIEGKFAQFPPLLMENAGVMKYLESIIITRTDADGPSDYRWIVDLPALTEVWIEDPFLTEAQVQMIVQRPGIQTLQLVSNHLTGEFFTLVPAKHLRLIGLGSRSFDRKYLNHIAGLAPLQEVFLRDINLTPEDIAAISRIMTMGHFYIEYTTPHGPMDLSHLSKSTINWLDIKNLSLTSGDLKSISAMPNLNTLWLSGCQVEHGAFAQMTRPINRMVISLAGRTASDTYIDQLTHIRTPFELQASTASLSTSGYRQLAGNQYLTIFTGGEMTIDQLDIMLNNQSLRELDVTVSGTITSSTAEKIKAHIKLRQLTIRKLIISPKINAEIKEARPNLSIDFGGLMQE